ncbi:ABC transporter permease [Thioalkalivibrio sulfidiphilus]|uniref:ABC transporter permease n=1 Tax=Thioalkalivibrio sulfidiphilus TaxID=1033854 RepID=UPI000685CC7D|nr:iron ABC transporter permease [Thioalkalivibrio sulfidiphilus]
MAALIHSPLLGRAGVALGIRLPLLLVAAVLILAMGYPLLLLFLSSIYPDILGGSLDGFLDAYRRIGQTHDMLPMLWNSLAWAGATTVVSWLFGIPCGYYLARTNLPGKLWARLSLLVPIMTPPYIAALSYILVMQEGGFSDSLLGVMPETLRAWFFSFWGVTLVMALSSFGYVALAVEAGLQSIPRRLEDASGMFGATWSQTARLIVIPLLLPAILNSGLLVFLEALSNFGVPAVLGTRSNLPLLPAEIFFLVTSWPVDLALATALSSLLCLFALFTLYGSRILANILGGGNLKPGAVHTHALGAGGMLLGWLWFGGLFALSTLLPYFAMLLTSLADQWTDGLPSLTLDHYRSLFAAGSRGLDALLTSLWLAVAAASICVVVGSYIAYVNVRSSGPLQKILDGLAMLPRVIPKIVMAVALILAWNAPWLPFTLYNTVWMLLFAYVVIYITDALNYSNSRLLSMSPNLENAAAIAGANRIQIFLQIVLPQLRPVLIAAWLTTFIVTMRELVASMLLLPPGVDTTATYIFNQFEQGDISTAMAMATVTILLSTIVLALFQIRRRSV